MQTGFLSVLNRRITCMMQGDDAPKPKPLLHVDIRNVWVIGYLYVIQVENKGYSPHLRPFFGAARYVMLCHPSHYQRHPQPLHKPRGAAINPASWER